jgi:GT2 family glycosyltransferase
MSRVQPFFSIIVPTYNRPDRLAGCLRALAGLSYPRDRFEVIVIDDESPTPLDGAVMPWRSRLDLTLLTQTHAGPAAARNTGVARAKGDFIAFTDDDCAPAADWLHALAARFTVTPHYAIGGSVLNGLSRNPYATASQLLIDYLYTHYNANRDRALFLTSNNVAFPTDRFRAIGGFDTSFPLAAAEDRDLCDRWLLHGYRMIYAPEALVYHAHALTWRTFCRQHFNYGRGAAYFHHLRARREQDPIKLESLMFYARLLRYPFLRARLPRALGFAALFVISQIMNATGFWWQHTALRRLVPVRRPTP